MSKKYKNSYRGYLIDHHSPDPPIITLDKLDPEQYERLFKKAHLDMLMVYCKDHFGNAYYPTKIGRMHPALKIDYVQAMKDICERNNMEFMAYYSVGFDNLMALEHPDWALRNEQGNIERIKIGGIPPGQPPKWRWVCGNSPYRDYVLAQLAEIVKNYNPDTVFLDIFNSPLCYCKYCQKKYKAKYKRPLPRGKDKEKYWREIQDFKYQNYYDFAKAITDKIRKIDKTVAITVNGGCIMYKKKMLDLFDYTYAEPHFGGTYLASAFANGTGVCPQIGPGTVSVVYDPPKVCHFRLQAAYIASQGCRPFMFSGSQHTDGSLDKLEFRNIGKAYGEVKRYQKYLTNCERIRDIGIIYSENSRLYERDYSFGQEYGESILGGIEAAAYSKYSYDVIPEWKVTPKILKQCKIVFLPNLSCMPKRLAELFRDYVKNGGILVSTQKTSLCNEKGRELKNFQLADVFGCDFGKVNKKYNPNPWGSFLNRLSHPIWRNLPDTELAVSAPFVETNATKGVLIAKHILPCLKLTPDKWVNWWSPPWQKFTDFPAIIINNYGKGKSIYLSFELFSMIRRSSLPFLWPNVFINELLQFFVSTPSIIVKDIPQRGVGVTYFRRKDSSIIIHQVNHTVEHLRGEILSIDGGILQISNKYLKAKRCYQVYPKEKEIKLFKKGSNSTANLPNLKLHNIYIAV